MSFLVPALLYSVLYSAGAVPSAADSVNWKAVEAKFLAAKSGK